MAFFYLPIPSAFLLFADGFPTQVTLFSLLLAAYGPPISVGVFAVGRARRAYGQSKQSGSGAGLTNRWLLVATLAFVLAIGVAFILGVPI